MESPATTRDIVRRVGHARTNERADEQRRQWRAQHLAVPGTGHLRFDALPSDDGIADQLARRVAGDPTDARLHVARVNHHVLHEDADGVYAALVDLFFAFGATGVGLRTRLLNGARRIIGPQRTALLERHLATGFSARTSLQLCPGSMLSNGVTGETDLVRAHTGAPA